MPRFNHKILNFYYHLLTEPEAMRAFIDFICANENGSLLYMELLEAQNVQDWFNSDILVNTFANAVAVGYLKDTIANKELH